MLLSSTFFIQIGTSVGGSGEVAMLCSSPSPYISVSLSQPPSQAIPTPASSQFHLIPPILHRILILALPLLVHRLLITNIGMHTTIKKE